MTKMKTASTKKTKVSYVFPEDGLRLEGTVEQILDASKKLGRPVRGMSIPTPRGYYLSESRGLLAISDMNDYHLRRAFIKRAKDYLDGIYKAEKSNRDLIKDFMDLTEDPLLNDMFAELQKRV